MPYKPLNSQIYRVTERIQMIKHSPTPNRIASFLIALAICTIFSPASRAFAAGKKSDGTPMAGQLIVSGNVTVNDKKALNGTTVFSSSRIAVACAKGNSAIVNLGKLGRIELTPGTKLTLKFTDGMISGDLLEGKAVVNAPAGVKISINTPDGVTNSDGKDAVVTSVNSQRGVRCVPAVVSGSSSSNALSSLSPAALAGILGAGGAAAAGAAVASSSNTNAASSIIP
jgi:hypothetical protein